MAAPAINHQFVSAIADGADATVVRPSNWNAPHSLANFTAVSKLLGSSSVSAAADEITLGSGLSMSASTLSVTAATSVPLNGITAATGAVTIASGNNTGIVWNWANTADSTVCHAFGETTAATGGTSTLGIPNQVLLKLSTLASSTQSPFQVFHRGTHVVSAGSGANPQFLFNLGNAVAPVVSTPASAGTGIFFVTNVTAIAISGIENSRFSAGAFQLTKGTADAVSYALNFRKSRGTVASPSAITTGDDLVTINGFGYVGATNTFTVGARITFDSIGTISDSTSGIGGVIRFLTANQGTVGVVEAMTVWNSGDVTIGLPTPATTATIGFPQIPTMSGTPTGVPTVITGFTPMVYDTTNAKIWIYDYGAAAWKGVAVA